MTNVIVTTSYNIKKDIESFEIDNMLIFYILHGFQNRLDIVMHRLWFKIYKVDNSILETLLSSFCVNLI